jgi:prolyl-tRNA synthetase
MRYSRELIRTSKGAKIFDSVNATLLQQAGFVSQTMAGVYTFLPLGWRVLNKIEDIIRGEMDKLGAEMLMPAIVPEALWRETGRLDTVSILMGTRPANAASRKKNDASYILNPTHEEVITPIVRHLKPSYKDLPFAVYQIQTKFRNEERPKSGLLRGREFRMKDLYSFHATSEDFENFYNHAKEVYQATFGHLGIGQDTVIALASGGEFTREYSHEFDTRCDTGEDTVCYDEVEDVYYNEEVAPAAVKKRGDCFRAAEVGNIFPLGTKFSEAFNYYFRDETGQRNPVIMASYGIGSSRVMGVLVEKYHDDRGIIWPEAVAPFRVHLVGLALEKEDVRRRADEVYKQLTARGIEVLYDDRTTASVGEKLADADLIGIPWRVVVSPKTGQSVEIKKRNESEAQIGDLETLWRML